MASEAAPVGEDGLPAPAKALGRLAAEAELVKRLLQHIDEHRAWIRARLERLERCRAGEDPSDRASGRALLAAEAAAIESALRRLQVAASLAKSFARLRAGEAERLNGEGRCASAAGPSNGGTPARCGRETEDSRPAAQRTLGGRS